MVVVAEDLDQPLAVARMDRADHEQVVAVHAALRGTPEKDTPSRTRDSPLGRLDRIIPGRRDRRPMPKMPGIEEYERAEGD